MEKELNNKTEEEIKKYGKDKNKNKILKDEFKIDYTEENMNDEYEKVLEKDIENNCDLNIYVDKLEIEEKKDEDIILLEKQEIIDFKNYQIQKLKAYIASLEKEKEDLIENYRNTTNTLLDRIKDLESKNIGARPETAFILDKMQGKKNDKKGLDNKAQIYDFDKQLEYELEPYTNKNAEFDEKIESFGSKKTRCPNCTKEFSSDVFLAHSLNCLRLIISNQRNTIRCKICQNVFDVSQKQQHLKDWRSPQKFINAVNCANISEIELCFDHGLKLNSKMSDNGDTPIHILARNGKYECFSKVLGREFDVDILNNNNDTPLLVAIEQNNVKVAKTLIELGASLEAKNNLCLSPLMLSCKKGNIELSELLISNGANINESNIMGETPLKIAQLNNHDELAVILTTKYKASIKRVGSSLGKIKK